MPNPLPDTFLAQVADALAPETLDLARRLFETGSVMQLERPTRRIVEAKVANERGRMEQVRVMFAQGGMLPSCTCGKTKNFCAHAAAVLMELDRRSAAMPAGAPASGSPGMQPASAWHPRTDAAPRSLAELVPAAGRPRPVLRLELETEPAAGLLRPDAAIILGAVVLLNGREYGAANVRRLAEDGEAAGGMRWEDFAMPVRQAMRLLTSHGQPDKAGFRLAAADFSELLNLLRGYSELHGPRGPLAVRETEARAVLRLTDAGPDAAQNGTPAAKRVSPGFEAADGSPLPAAELAAIPGRGGHWLCCRGAFHWFPAVLEAGWFRLFLNGAAEELPAAAARGMLDHGLLAPANIREGAAGSAEPAAETDAGLFFQPVLCLDWECGRVTAALEFDYDGVRVPPGDGLVRTPQRILQRRGAHEAAAETRLLAQGFAAARKPSDGRFTLEDPARVWDFWRQGQEALPADWRLFLSTTYIRARASSTLLNLDVQPADESASWFDLDCRLLSDTGKPLPWKKIAAAVKAGLDTVLVEGNTLVHIPEQVRALVALLEHGAEGHGPAGGRFRFPVYQAPALHAAFADRLGGARTRWAELARRLSRTPQPETDMFSPELARVLRGYQKDGVAWLRLMDECGFHGVLADEMGLGKTVQALAWLAWRRRTGRARHPALVVCPSSLLENWRNETARFVPEFRPLIIRGLDRAPLLKAVPEHDLAITSYALLRRDAKAYRGMEFDAVILDEAQHIKNPNTANAQACKQLRAGHRLILTGTPLENSAHELWSLFDFLLPGYLGSRQAFRHRYEDETDAPAGAAARQELARRVRPFLLRRMKADVCQELPPKIEQHMYCEMEPPQWKLYTTFLMAGRAMLRSPQDGWAASRMQMLAVLTRLRQICCHPELLPAELRHGAGAHQSAKVELLKEVLLETLDSGHRVAVFSQFTSFLKLLRPWLDAEGIPYEYLDGATTDRQDRVDRFNRDASIPVFLLSLKAGGTGLNLTGADTVVHCDPWWNPAAEDQATDRTHRIGQTRQVTSIKLLVRNSVEEKIHALQQRKRLLFNQVMAGAPGRAGELTREDVEFLLGDG